MSHIKKLVILVALLVLWNVSAFPVSASNVELSVEPVEQVQVETSTISEPISVSWLAIQVEQARQRTRVERLPRRLPRWYPPPFCSKKKRGGKGSVKKGNRGKRGSRKQKQVQLSEPSEPSQRPNSSVWSSESTSVAGTGLSWVQATSITPVVNETPHEISHTMQVLVTPALFSMPITTQDAMVDQFDLKEKEDNQVEVTFQKGQNNPSTEKPLSDPTVNQERGQFGLKEKEGIQPEITLQKDQNKPLSERPLPDPSVDQEWAEQQWGQADLGDKRRTKRAVKMGQQMVLNPGGSIPEQMGSWKATKAAYRLLNEEDVTLENLSTPHWEQTRQLASTEKLVLFIQDTTEADFTRQRHIKNLGPIGDGRGRGFLLHSAMAFVPTTKTILGMAHQHAFLRLPKSKEKWARSPEGLVWETATKAIGKPPAGTIWVQMGDRGSDSFGFMATCDPEKGLHFLIRLKQNRVITWPERDEPNPPVGDPERKLISYAKTLPAQGQTFTVEVAPRKKQPRRTATVQMSWGQVTIPAPTQAPEILRQHKPIKAWVVRVWEPNPPPNVEPVQWVLLSSLPVLSWEDAHERSQWYAQRWLIEDFHKALKTGCRMEHTQLDDRFDIQRLLGFLSPIAVRLLQIRQVARNAPDTLARSEIDPLILHISAVQLQLNPDTMTVAQFWAGVAQLGGHLGRTNDGPPGWITLWRGYRQLQLMVRGARIALDTQMPDNPLLDVF